MMRPWALAGALLLASADAVAANLRLAGFLQHFREATGFANAQAPVSAPVGAAAVAPPAAPMLVAQSTPVQLPVQYAQPMAGQAVQAAPAQTSAQAPQTQQLVAAPPPAAPQSAAPQFVAVAAKGNSTFADMEATLENFMRQNAGLEQANAALEKRNAELEGTNVVLEQRNYQLEQAHAEIEVKYADLHGELAQIQAQATAAQKETEQGRANQTQLVQALQQAYEERARMQVDSSIKDSKITQLANSIASVRDVIGVLKGQTGAVQEAGRMVDDVVTKLPGVNSPPAEPIALSQPQAAPAAVGTPQSAPGGLATSIWMPPQQPQQASPMQAIAQRTHFWR